MRTRILNILHDINPYVDIDDNTLLIEEEVIDSIGIVLLLQQIEDEIGVFIPQERIDMDDFTNIDSITKMIQTKGIPRM